MITFYLSMECENCGHDIYRRCATTDTLRLGEPVIPFDLGVIVGLLFGVAGRH